MYHESLQFIPCKAWHGNSLVGYFSYLGLKCTSYMVMGVSSFQNCDSAYFVMTCIEFRQGCLQVPYDIRRPFFAMRDAISQNTCVGESAFIMGLQTFYMRLDISLESLVNPSLFTLPRPLLWTQFPPVQNDYCIEKADILKDMCGFILSCSVCSQLLVEDKTVILFCHIVLFLYLALD